MLIKRYAKWISDFQIMPVHVHDRYLGIKKALKLLNFKALLSFMIHRITK